MRLVLRRQGARASCSVERRNELSSRLLFKFLRQGATAKFVHAMTLPCGVHLKGRQEIVSMSLSSGSRSGSVSGCGDLTKRERLLRTESEGNI